MPEPQLSCTALSATEISGKGRLGIDTRVVIALPMTAEPNVMPEASLASWEPKNSSLHDRDDLAMVMQSGFSPRIDEYGPFPVRNERESLVKRGLLRLLATLDHRKCGRTTNSITVHKDKRSEKRKICVTSSSPNRNCKIVTAEPANVSLRSIPLESDKSPSANLGRLVSDLINWCLIYSTLADRLAAPFSALIDRPIYLKL